MARKPQSKSKLSDADRHARFVETAREVGASDDPDAFERAWQRVVGPPKPPTDKSEV